MSTSLFMSNPNRVFRVVGGAENRTSRLNVCAPHGNWPGHFDSFADNASHGELNGMFAP